MKMNEEDLSISKEKNSKKTLLKVIVFFVLVFLIFTLFEIFLILKIKSAYNLNNEIVNDGIKYEKSIYTKYDNKIYASIFGIAYQLNNVDVDSFKVIDTKDYFESHVGVDKNNVYFGNQIVKDLNSYELYAVGNGYYSDGIDSYFCSDNFEKNENFSQKSKIRQYIEYYFFKGKKPQEYIYPFKKLETKKSLKAVENLSYFATDGEKVYYKGEELANADLSTLKNVDGYNEYFVDKENVYYKSKLLNLSSNDTLKVVSVEQAERKYLLDGLDGNVFLEDYAFDKKYIPYQILGEKSNHIKDLLFLSKDGIFFYNFETKEQERVGDNIFIGKIEEISPSIISDDKNIYYLHSYDIYRKKKTKHGYIDVLVSKNIGVFYLDDKKDWEKIRDIDSGTMGQIWNKKEKYYYFDDLGVYQLIDNVVYEISDKETLEYLLNNENISTDKIRELIKNKKLVVVNGKEVINAKIEYN